MRSERGALAGRAHFAARTTLGLDNHCVAVQGVHSGRRGAGGRELSHGRVLHQGGGEFTEVVVGQQRVRQSVCINDELVALDSAGQERGADSVQELGDEDRLRRLNAVSVQVAEGIVPLRQVGIEAGDTWICQGVVCVCTYVPTIV
jgi:hypothetical protein